jgi:hypothetical protein
VAGDRPGLARLGRVHQCRHFAGDAVLVRLGHRQAKADRDGRIHGVAALAQDFHAGFSGEVMAGGDDAAAAHDHRPPAGRGCGRDFHQKLLVSLGGMVTRLLG